MRATDFFNEDQFGTEPKRPARAGSRPSRGHGAEPRYKSAPVVPGGDNPDAVHTPNKGDEPVQRGDHVMVQDPDNIATVHNGVVKRIGREFVYVTLKDGETIAAPHDEVSKSYDVLSKRAHLILNKKGKHVGNYKVSEAGPNPKIGPNVIKYQNTKLNRPKNVEYTFQGFYIKFTPSEVQVYKGGDLVYTKKGNFEDPTNLQLNAVKATVSRLATGWRPQNVSETPKLSSREKFLRGLKRGGYDVEERSKFWDEKVKEIEAQIAAYDAEHKKKEQETDEGIKDKVVAGITAAALAASPATSKAFVGMPVPPNPSVKKVAVKQPDGSVILKTVSKPASKSNAPKKDVKEEAAGVGIVTKQNSTADVGPSTIAKNLKAFNLIDNIDEGTLTTDVAHALKRYGEHINSPLYKELGKMFSLGNIADALFMIKRLDSEDRNRAIKIISKAGGLLGSRLTTETHNDDEYVQQLTSEFIRRAKLGRRYTAPETILGMLDRFFKKFSISDQYFDDVFHRAVRTTDHEAGILEMETSLEEWKASRQLCRSSTPDKDLGASALASCKSQGLRARDGNKSHKLGKSPKSRTKMGGHRIKGKKYGGPLPDWS